ncbi:beta-phosphoglucomutase family hydrolase [Vibrio tubiashii]|uniref:beta-phosphoglucomutase family hydrolase n=1 Tax=Vibrio tubiashii TaxID=29498 RepID=UPI00234E69AA|nr:beta-phosphoglucomutase family hydrolase [Vibrio tubiashii]WCP70048.1 beta-phosphoglucomutase family hydrolase [Vibrio tubiashii]
MFENIEKYQALIFDMDGTIIDTMPAHLNAWQQTAEHFGFPFCERWLHSLGGMPSYKIAAEVNKKHGMSLEPKEVSRFKMDAFASLEEHGEPIDCTVNVLNHFFGKKKLAVGTGSQRESAIRLLTKAKLIDKLDAVVTATDVTNHKPNPDTFLQAAELVNTVPANCLVFEDTKLGLQAAHAAKMDCMMVEGDELVFYPYSE